jgi:hypothetical protein
MFMVLLLYIPIPKKIVQNKYSRHCLAGTQSPSLFLKCPFLQTHRGWQFRSKVLHTTGGESASSHCSDKQPEGHELHSVFCPVQLTGANETKKMQFFVIKALLFIWVVYNWVTVLSRHQLNVFMLELWISILNFITRRYLRHSEASMQFPDWSYL